MLISMLGMSATWLLAILICCGIGLSIQRLFGLEKPDADYALSSFWLGWASVLALLQLWHFFAPIVWPVLLLVGLLGGVGLAWNAGQLLGLFRTRQRFKLLFFGLSILAAAWLANRVMESIHYHNDAGIYYLPSVRWASAYPIVPGLGNLHVRLAFNSSYFLYAALLSTGLWHSFPLQLANGLLFLVIGLVIGLSVSKVVMNRGKVRVHDLLQILLAPSLVHLCFVHAPTASPDVPVCVLGIVVSARLAKMLFLEDDEHRMMIDAFFVVALSTVGVSIKLSFLAMGFVSSLVALAIIVYHGSRGKAHLGLKGLGLLLVPVVLVGIPWMIRGVILSGYLAFPIPYGSFDVDWGVPREYLIGTSRWIAGWAREPRAQPDGVLASWDWFAPWLKRMVGMRFDVILPLFMLCASGLFGILRRWRHRGEALRPGILILVPPAVSLVYWFFTAPNPRFVGGAFWLLGSGALVLVCTKRDTSRCTGFVVFLALLLGLYKAGVDVIRRGLFVGPGSEQGIYPIPAVEVKEFVTNSGLRVYVPRFGDQCWDTLLPCTPHPNPDLRLRREGEMRYGFMVSSMGEKSQ